MDGFDFPYVWRSSPEREEAGDFATDEEDEVVVVEGRVSTPGSQRR
ncbi:MAG: hypothetical protein ABEH81_12610 [Halopenitus sp.]